MKSRGSIYALGAGAKRGLVLLGTALLLSTMLLQYVVAAAPVLAVPTTGVLELDGNAVNDAAAGNDWDQVYAGTSSADATTFVTDGVPERAFTGGGSKDILNTDQWQHTLTSAPDKDDLQHAFAALYGDLIYFGADRFASNGDAAVGFWFFRNGISINANGTFSPNHEIGDLFVVSHFVNGGSGAEIELYEWVGSGGSDGALDLVASGQGCTGAPASGKACAIVNDAATPSPWPYTPKTGAAGTFPANAFFEGGLDLAKVYGEGAVPCFSGFLVETRSSQEPSAELKDFVGGSFNTCAPPAIATQVSASSVDFGGSVTDTATLSGDDGPVTGTVRFFVCGPSGSAPDCSTGGTQVGGAITIAGGSATSAAYDIGVTAAAAGRYCWRAEYTPDASSQYLAGSHTNLTTECFKVDPATISITKTANPVGPVNAGESIGFDITVENNGTQTTLGVNVSDTLPAGVSWTADAPTGSTTGLSCSITSGVLTCTKPSLAAGASFTVHVHGMTDAADCGTVNNTAAVATSNDGSDSDGASVVVNCPDIKVTKTPDGGKINAGDTATFSIKVENLGPGTATDVVLTDNLPAGQHWTEDEADCSISGADGSQVLTCNVGTLAADASKTYSVSAVTDATDCGDINNTASATATNEPSDKLGNNSDNGSIAVLCAQIDITKTADNGTVNAGDQIGFTITVANNGTGTAYTVSASDTLNADFTWTLVAPVTGWTLVGNQLSYTAASLAAGASSSVHVVATSTAADCGVVDNTASVTAGNDGSDQASASVTINCPDVTVTKTAVASPVNAGDPIAFDITVTNLGPGTAYDVTLTDTLPAGISWTENSDACSITAGVLTCNFGDLAKDGTASVRVSGTTAPVNCGTIPNTATVAASNEAAVNTGNNSDDASVVVSCPDITVLKTAVATPVSAGDPIAFDITVSNSAAAGTGTAYDVTLTDPLPNGITWSEDSPACSITGTGDDQVLDCSWTSLALGASATVRVSGTTSSAVCGSIPNTATVSASNEKQGDTDDNSSTATVVVNCPDIHVDKTADNSPISAGDLASFTITVTNDGTGKAYDVTLTDTLPAGVSWTENSDSCSIAAGVLSCAFGTILPGASRVVTISGETDAQDCGVIPNTASALAGNESAADAEDNSDSASIVVDCPALVITKTADDPSVNATDEIGFVITVTNTGDGNAYGVTVNDTLPTDSGLGWSIDQANSSTGWSIVGGVLAYGPATLASKASVHVHIVSDTTPASCGLVDNTASVTYQGGSGEDSSRVTVLCPDVTISKTAATSPILAGQTASYTISVWNTGKGTAYGVTISDTLPAGIAWTENSESCSITNGVLTCNVGDLAGDAIFSVTVSGPSTVAVCGQLPNTATVAAANEADAAKGNNSDDATITVQCASISLVKTAGTAADGSDLLLAVPANVVFTYVVTNTGTAALQNVVLVDDNATPANTSDDITITCPKTTLAAGESMTCTATLPVGIGLRINIATVTANPVLEPGGRVSDTDDAVVRVPEPEVTPTPTPKPTPTARLTMPPTSTVDGGASGTDGNGLFLILIAIAGLMLTAGTLIPAPARARRRNNRS